MRGGLGGTETRPWLPQLLHALSIALTATAVYVGTKNQVLAGASILFASKFFGSLINRTVRPKRVIRPLLGGAAVTQEYLLKVRREVHLEVHTLVNRLATWRAEVDLAVDDAIAKLNGLESHEATEDNGHG